jgi:hypothetical protein
VGRDRDANAGGGQRAQLRGRELSESACEPRAPDGPAPPRGRRGEEQAQPHREVLHRPAVAQAPAELGDGDFSWVSRREEREREEREEGRAEREEGRTGAQRIEEERRGEEMRVLRGEGVNG